MGTLQKGDGLRSRQCVVPGREDFLTEKWVSQMVVNVS